MYKYTPNYHILYVMGNKKQYAYYNIQELLQEYMGHGVSVKDALVLAKEIIDVRFYSPVVRRTVPVAGIMLPVSMFIETVL